MLCGRGLPRSRATLCEPFLRHRPQAAPSSRLYSLVLPVVRCRRHGQGVRKFAFHKL